MNEEITLDQVKNFLETDPEGQKLLQSFSDAKVTKAIETWKENNLQSEVDKKVNELYPEQDPKDIEIKKLSLELENFRKQSLISELTGEAIKTAMEKKIPVDIVKLLVTSDKDKNNANIQTLEETWNAALKEHIKLNINSTTPNFSNSNNSNININDFNEMSYQDKKSLKQNNPELYGEFTQ